MPNFMYTPSSQEQAPLINKDIPRSKLYSLEPVGVGTLLIEGLSSYIARLAAAHCVSFQTLMTEVIRPARYSGESLHNTINGLSPFSLDITRSVETNTGMKNINLLSLSYWSSVVSQSELNHDSHVWCPDCYETWRLSNKPIYTPLIWTLKCLPVCPIHFCQLLNSCPYTDCGKPLKRISEPGFCAYCKRPLSKYASEHIQEKQSSIMMDPWIEWVISNCKDLILIPLEGRSSPTFSAAHMSICSTIDRLGGCARVARELGLSVSVVIKWTLPKPIALHRILQLGWKADKRVSEILGEESAASAPTHRDRQSRRYPNGYIEAEVAKALAGEAPPKTLKELCRVVGCSYPTLINRVPDIQDRLDRGVSVDSKPMLDLHKGADRELARKEILIWLSHDECLSAKEISRRVGIHQSSMKSCFPDLHEQAVSRYRQNKAQRKSDLRDNMHKYLASPSVPPKSLTEFADELGTSYHSLQELDLQASREIQRMHVKYFKRRPTDAKVTSPLAYEEVESIVEEVRHLTPPISRQEFFRRYGYSIRRYPDLMAIIGQCYDDHILQIRRKSTTL